jgi:hypothetical protein
MKENVAFNQEEGFRSLRISHVNEVAKRELKTVLRIRIRDPVLFEPWILIRDGKKFGSRIRDPG